MFWFTFQLISSGRRENTPVRCRWDLLHLLTVDRHWFTRAVEIDIAAVGAVRERVIGTPVSSS
jgi:hypothetical protein